MKISKQPFETFVLIYFLIYSSKHIEDLFVWDLYLVLEALWFKQVVYILSSLIIAQLFFLCTRERKVHWSLQEQDHYVTKELSEYGPWILKIGPTQSS